jgi:hypothetical protein
MERWKVADRQFMAARIEPGVCKCTERPLRYSIPGWVHLVRLPAPRVGVLRLLFGHMFPATLPPWPEPVEVQSKVWHTSLVKSKCNWCKYLEAMGVTQVRLDYDPCRQMYTLTRED